MNTTPREKSTTKSVFFLIRILNRTGNKNQFFLIASVTEMRGKKKIRRVEKRAKSYSNWIISVQRQSGRVHNELASVKEETGGF